MSGDHNMHKGIGYDYFDEYFAQLNFLHDRILQYKIERDEARKWARKYKRLYEEQKTFAVRLMQWLYNREELKAMSDKLEEMYRKTWDK